MEDINEHLTDIVADVNRIRKAVNDDERPSKLDEDAIKSRLCDISSSEAPVKTSTEQKDELWRDGVPHLQYLPHDVRVMAIQAAIQTWGPAPNDLGDELRRLMDPQTKAVVP